MQKLTETIADARKRASFHRGKGHRDVFIAQVNVSDTEPYRLRIEFLQGPIELSGRIHRATNTMLFPMQEIGPKFHIELVQQSEWLALQCVPPELITYLPF